MIYTNEDIKISRLKTQNITKIKKPSRTGFLVSSDSQLFRLLFVFLIAGGS